MDNIEILELDEIKPRKIKHKMKRSSKIIILLLFILILLLLGYFIYDKYFNNTTNKIIKEELNINDIFVKELYDTVKLTKNEDTKFSKLNNMTKLYLAYRKIPHNKFFNSECSLFSEVKLKKNNDLYMCTSEGKNSFSKKDLEFEYNKIFGKTIIKHENIITSSSIYKYVKSKDIYILGEYLGGSDDIVESSKKLVKATKENDYVYLYESASYLNKETGEKIVNSKYYKSGTYKYTFKLINNNYIYKSKELVK